MKLLTPRTFRATTEAWLGQLLLPLFFFVLLTITAVNAAVLSLSVGVIGLVILSLVVVVRYLVPMVRNWLFIDATAMEGCLDGCYFHVYWTEVLAAWLYERQKRRYLCLGTREGTLIIPLRFFDDCTIWQEVRGAVPPAALEENAIQRLPDFHDWEAARDTLLEDASPRQVADHWMLQVIGWTGVAFFLFGAIESLQARGWGQALLYFALAAASLAMLLGWGVTEIGPERVQRSTMLGRWTITWDEVRWIEIDWFESVIVLVGENRQLVLTGPGIWNAAGKKETLAMLLAQAGQRCLPLRRSPLAFLKVSHNTRAKKKREDQS